MIVGEVRVKLLHARCPAEIIHAGQTFSATMANFHPCRRKEHQFHRQKCPKQFYLTPLEGLAKGRHVRRQ